MRKQKRKCDGLMENQYQDLLTEIAKLLQKKYNTMSEVSRLTEEMAQTLSRNDRVSVQMLLEMREEELNKIREYDKHIFLLRDSAPAEVSQWIAEAVKGKEPVSETPYGKEGAALLRVAGNVRSLWERVMVVDRNMNRKLAGQDSHYAKKGAV